MENLTQKRLFEKRKFEILDDVIKCEISNFYRKRINHIPLNYLSKYPDESWTSPVLLCSIAFISWYFTIKTILFLNLSKFDYWFAIIAIVAIFVTIELYRRSYKKLSFDLGGSELSFILDSPNETTVREFINQILVKRENLLKLEDTSIGESDKIEKLNNLHWYFENEFIDIDEFNELKREIITNQDKHEIN